MNIHVSNFDIEQIAISGQCFRMNKISGEDDKELSYEIIARDKYLHLTQISEKDEKGHLGGELILDCSQEDFDDFWRHYFDLDTDYGEIIKRIDPEDKYLTQAAEIASGVRILRQDLWEMIVTFLISQQNNIKRIRKCVENICEKYGEKIQLSSNAPRAYYYAFPTPESLANLPEDALMECNLGYRSKYVVRTAGDILFGKFDLDHIASIPTYEEARKELLKFYGVGNKVADCICLFARHDIDAFPIDTHIKQVCDRHYNGHFPLDRYRGCAGVMQQYIFFHDLIVK